MTDPVTNSKQFLPVITPGNPLTSGKDFQKNFIGQGFRQPIERIFTRYGLTDASQLTENDCRALTLGMYAHLRAEDNKLWTPESLESVRTLLEELHPDLKLFNPSYKDKMLTDLNFLKTITKANDFHTTGNPRPDAPQTSLIYKVAIAVFFTLAGIALVTAGALLFTASLGIAAIVIGAIILAAMKAIAIYNLTVKSITLPHSDKKIPQKCAASEYLAHKVAYDDLESGQLIPIREKHGLVHAQVSKVINKGGYVCAVLVHVQEADAKEANGNFRVQVLYRGTHDLKSASRSREPFSPGHESFELYRNEILQAIQESVPEHVQNVTLETYGHSLGGGDAQRFGALIALAIHKIAQGLQADVKHVMSDGSKPSIGEPDWNCPKLRAMIEKVRKVEVRVFNSVGIAKTTNEMFKQCALEINGQIPEMQDVEDEDVLLSKPTQAPKKPCVFVISINKVGGDFVQQVGETTLGYNLQFHSPNIKRSVRIVDLGYEGPWAYFSNYGLSALHAHQSINFNARANGGFDPRFGYANSKDNLAAVEAHAGDHLVLASNSTWQFIKRFITWPMGSALPA